MFFSCNDIKTHEERVPAEAGAGVAGGGGPEFVISEGTQAVVTCLHGFQLKRACRESKKSFMCRGSTGLLCVGWVPSLTFTEIYRLDSVVSESICHCVNGILTCRHHTVQGTCSEIARAVRGHKSVHGGCIPGIGKVCDAV